MIILKLGGSVLTKKDSNHAEVNYKNLNRIATEIHNFFLVKDSNHDFADGLIIVHGAGSFGHPYAQKYQIGKPFKREEYGEKRIGFSKTQNSVNKLNTIICECLISKKIPCVSIQPSSFITTNNKRINTFNLNLIVKYLDEGFVPVIYGDVVLDTKLKVAVLSGDQILQYIAKNLKSRKINEIILGTDVDGVFTKNPKKHNNAKLIRKVSSLEDIEVLDSTTNIDVTGGMIGKIKELLELADLGIESKIINANKEGLIANALLNKKVKCSLITKNK
ncbi:MAG: isopentenyl phosphate kinase family protein [Methanobacteriaceae archaeon]|nr:isopentenyl phosphate kinase family protein [Candidatus Methanorudis spinitermitis]